MGRCGGAEMIAVSGKAGVVMGFPSLLHVMWLRWWWGRSWRQVCPLHRALGSSLGPWGGADLAAGSVSKRWGFTSVVAHGFWWGAARPCCMCPQRLAQEAAQGRLQVLMQAGKPPNPCWTVLAEHAQGENVRGQSGALNLWCLSRYLAHVSSSAHFLWTFFLLSLSWKSPCSSELKLFVKWCKKYALNNNDYFGKHRCLCIMQWVLYANLYMSVKQNLPSTLKNGKHSTC